MKRDEFREMLKLAVLDVAERFSKQFSGDPALDQYVDDLMHDLSALQISLLPGALGDHRRDGKFFPSTGEIRERVLPAQRTKYLERLAWLDEYVKKWGVSRLGAAKRVLIAGHAKFVMIKPDPIPEDIAYALQQIGGYEYFASHERKAESFVRRDFLKALEALDEAGPDRAKLLSKPEAAQLLGEIQDQAAQLSEAEPRSMAIEQAREEAASVIGARIPREQSPEEFEQQLKKLNEQKERLLKESTS